MFIRIVIALFFTAVVMRAVNKEIAQLKTDYLSLFAIFPFTYSVIILAIAISAKNTSGLFAFISIITFIYATILLVKHICYTIFKAPE